MRNGISYILICVSCYLSHQWTLLRGVQAELSIRSTSPNIWPHFLNPLYLTDISVLNHISSPTLDCSQVFLVLGTPEMGTVPQMFFSNAEQIIYLNLLTISFIKQPKTLLFSVFWVYVQNTLNKPLVFWLLQSSTCTATKFSPFPTLSSQRVGQEWTKCSEGTQPGELT